MIPGDIVKITSESESSKKVIVDIVHDGEVELAILREEDDMKGENLLAMPISELSVVGHSPED